MNTVISRDTPAAELSSDIVSGRIDRLVKLSIFGDDLMTRSLARRVLTGLDQFRLITFDYDRVPVIGQAFADEIYRVFQRQHPEIVLSNTSMNDGVAFMVQRAITEASRRSSE